MLIIQHNCGQGNESTIESLQTALSIKARIVYFTKKTFIGNKSITHSAFNFYWPGG